MQIEKVVYDDILNIKDIIDEGKSTMAKEVTTERGQQLLSNYFVGFYIVNLTAFELLFMKRFAGSVSIIKSYGTDIDGITDSDPYKEGLALSKSIDEDDQISDSNKYDFDPHLLNATRYDVYVKISGINLLGFAEFGFSWIYNMINPAKKNSGVENNQNENVDEPVTAEDRFIKKFYQNFTTYMVRQIEFTDPLVEYGLNKKFFSYARGTVTLAKIESGLKTVSFLTDDSKQVMSDISSFKEKDRPMSDIVYTFVLSIPVSSYIELAINHGNIIKSTEDLKIVLDRSNIYVPASLVTLYKERISSFITKWDRFKGVNVREEKNYLKKFNYLLKDNIINCIVEVKEQDTELDGILKDFRELTIREDMNKKINQVKELLAD